MLFDLFKNFKLRFLVICLNCSNEKEIHFVLGDFVNLEGDFINKNENDCKYICGQCSLEIFIDLKKLFNSGVLRSTYNEILLLQKENQGD